MTEITAERTTAYIALGSNLGNRRRNIDLALALMSGCQELQITVMSPLMETHPVGGPPQGKYLNGAVEVETLLQPRPLLAFLQDIEARLGRTRKARWGPRTMDLDILLYGTELIEEKGLVIPHPRMHRRLFVLEPLCEIAPDAWHPKLKKKVSELLEGELGRQGRIAQ